MFGFRILLAAAAVCCGALASPAPTSAYSDHSVPFRPGTFARISASSLKPPERPHADGIPGGGAYGIRGGMGCVAVAGPMVALRGGGNSAKARGFMGRVMIKDLLEGSEGMVGTMGGQEVRVCGWARTMRVQGAGSFAFIELNDGSCFCSIQVIADKWVSDPFLRSFASHPLPSLSRAHTCPSA